MYEKILPRYPTWLGYPMCAYTSYMGSCTAICRLCCCTLQSMQQKVCRLACIGGLGWMAIYLNNTYGFIRHGDSRSNTCMPGTRSCCLVDASGSYDNIRSEYRDLRGFHAGSGKFCIVFGPGGIPQDAGTTRTLQQAAMSLKKANPQARSMGSTRGSAKTNRGSWWLDPRVTQISRVMTRPNPRYFEKLLPDPTRPARF